MTLVMTGLRKGELSSLTVGQMHLEGNVAYAVLHAADEKNRQGSDIPLRGDLAADLKSWLDDKLQAARTKARTKGDPIPVKLLHETLLFNVPTGLIRILDRDLSAAGIPKRDDRNRTVDVHVMRHTFGTHLSMGGVAPRTAQAAMRHSKLELTMNVYTAPRFLDVAGALDSLPSLSLGDKPDREKQSATGTYGDSQLVAPLVVTSGNSSKSQSTGDKPATAASVIGDVVETPKKPRNVEEKTPLSSPNSGVHLKRVTRLELATFSLEG